MYALPSMVAQHFRDADGAAAMILITAVGAGCGLLSDKSRGSHLTAGHAVNCVVDEDRGDLFAAVCSVNDFSRADGSKVAVTLICENNIVGVGALNTGCSGGRSSVCCLDGCRD